MLLIETYLNGKLHRQHWHAICNTEDEVVAKIEDMRVRHTQNDGSYQWTHDYREVTQEEINAAIVRTTIERPLCAPKWMFEE